MCDALLGVKHCGVFIHQLERVTIASADKRFESLFLGPLGKGGDDIIRLKTFNCKVPNAEGVYEVEKIRSLGTKFIRCRGTLSFIFRKSLAAKGLAGYIESRGNMSGLLVSDQVDEHRCKTINRISRLTRCGRKILNRQSVIRAIGQRMAIDKQ